MAQVIGIDASARTSKVGLARGHELDGELVLTEVTTGRSVTSVPGVIADWIQGEPALIAIDAPLGWPRALGESLSRHWAGRPLSVGADSLFRRMTDEFVRERLGKKALDVGADKIARTAHAALELIADVQNLIGREIPLAWDSDSRLPACVEVYPAASLIARGLKDTGYKDMGAKKQVGAREQLVAMLGTHWRLAIDPALLVSSDDALDAAVCALEAAMFLRGGCVAPRPVDEDSVRREGWIWFADGAGC